MNVFLSCVKSKQNKACEAQNMYTSDLFKKSLAFAKTLKPNNIYILSAKYGLLKLTDTIAPYNLTLNNMSEKSRKAWAYKVYNQCVQEGIDFNEEAVFLCGLNYRKYLITKFKNAKAPLKNLGIGKQLAFYKERTSEQ